MIMCMMMMYTEILVVLTNSSIDVSSRWDMNSMTKTVMNSSNDDRVMIRMKESLIKNKTKQKP